MTLTAHSIIAGVSAETPSVEAATRSAALAFAAYRETSPERRAVFLEAVASQIEADREPIIEAATAESGLPEGRVFGELGRTTGQLRLFADVVRRGDHIGVRIDRAKPEREPIRGRSCVSAWFPSVQWPCSAPATFPSPSRPPEATLLQPWLPAARS